MSIDDIDIYLPKFLSSESERELFKGLKDFPINFEKRFYASSLKNSKYVYQGDGIKDLLVVNIPNNEMKPAPCLILSNTCDIDPENIRNFPSQVVYAPIFNLKKYQETIYGNSKKSHEQIAAHISSIKKQEVTQIFYLPKLEGILEESIVFLDRVNNSPNEMIDRDHLSSKRLFTLSNLGEYLFILKLSIHFSRIQDKVDRK